MLMMIHPNLARGNSTRVQAEQDIQSVGSSRQIGWQITVVYQYGCRAVLVCRYLRMCMDAELIAVMTPFH